MILYSLRRRPLPLTIVLVLIALRLLWTPSPQVGMDMTMAQCWGLSVVIVVSVSVVSVGARVLWLAWQSARSLARLPCTVLPPTLTEAIRGVKSPKVVFLSSGDAVAFCGGMLRPRVYVSAGLLDMLSEEEFAAVLSHETAHARRRDPLRRLLFHAASEVLFFLPLLRWAARVHKERAELIADRAAIEQVGARHVAGALLAMDGGPMAPAGVAAFDGAAEARVAQLVGAPRPSAGIDLSAVSVSIVGLVAALSLMMCVGQELWVLVTR